MVYEIIISKARKILKGVDVVKKRVRNLIKMNLYFLDMFLGPSIIEFQEKYSLIWKKKRENNLIHDICHSSMFKIYGIGTITYNGFSSKMALMEIFLSINSLKFKLGVICLDILSTRILFKHCIDHVTSYCLKGLDEFISKSSENKYDVVILHGIDMISTKDRDKIISYLGHLPKPYLCINILTLSSSKQFYTGNLLIWNIWSNIEGNDHVKFISCNDQS